MSRCMKTLSAFMRSERMSQTAACKPGLALSSASFLSGTLSSNATDN